MLAAARESPTPGDLLVAEGVPMTFAELARYADVSVRIIKPTLETMVSLGMVVLDGPVIRLPNFTHRQFESDDVTARTRAHRERSKERSNAVPSNVRRNTPETETETETELPPTEVGATTSPTPRKRKHPLPEGWLPSAESVAKIADECPGLDSQRATVQFIDYWRGAGTPKIEWDSVWRNWMRREFETKGRAATGSDRESQRKAAIFAAALERGAQQEERANVYRMEIGQ